MAVIHHQPQSLVSERALAALYRVTLGRVLTWNDKRLTRNTLAKLSDAELHDIGLERGDIDRVAKRF